MDDETLWICSHALIASTLGTQGARADFEFISVNLLAGEHKHPDFLRLNPAGKGPVLVDGDIVIPESGPGRAVSRRQMSREGAIARQPRGKRASLSLDIFAVTELEQPLWRISKHAALYPKDRRPQRKLHWREKSFSP